MSTHPAPLQGDAAGSTFVRQDVQAAKAAGKAARDEAFRASVAANTELAPRRSRLAPEPAPVVVVVPEPAQVAEPAPVDGEPFATIPEGTPEPAAEEPASTPAKRGAKSGG